MTDRSVILLIAAVLVAVFGVLFYRLSREDDVLTQPAPDAVDNVAKVRTAVRVGLESCNRRFDRTVLEGWVENTGNVDVSYVTVRTLWKNRDGLIVGEGTLYAVNGVRLAPGERRRFEDSTALTTAVRCNAVPLDWW